MMKKVVLGMLVALACILGWPLSGMNHVEAANFLYNNLNYPYVGGGGGLAVYMDLSSCTFVRNEADSYEFASVIVTTHKMDSEPRQKVVYFRQMKDGYSSPEYSYDNISWKRLRYLSEEVHK